MKNITFPALSAFSPKQQLQTILSGAPESGYTIADVRSATKVLDKLDACKDLLELEDAEYSFVLNRIRQVPWAMAHSDIVAFVDAIENAA
jgi:hypothetical protein